MNARFLILICISVTLSFASTRATACPSCEPPVAGFAVHPASYAGGIHIIAIDTNVNFSAGLLSYDPDHCGPSHYYWDLWDPSYASTPADHDFRAAEYDTVGDRYIRLSVSDDDYPCCCYGEPGCADKMSETAVETIRVVKVGSVRYLKPGTGYVDVPNPLYVAKGTTVTFKAMPNPARTPVWPPDTPAWSGSSGTSGASGTGITKDVTFNIVSASPTDYKTVTSACGNSVSVSVVVVDVTISSDPGWVLAYTGTHSGSEPEKTATACVMPIEPEGGIFSWSYQKNGGGDIEFVSGDTTKTVTMRGTAPSSADPDVVLKVTYSLDGGSCEDTEDLVVLKPYATIEVGGACHRDARRHYRYYYHRVYDQFWVRIDEEGIPFDEIVFRMYGEELFRTGPGSTAYCSSDYDPPNHGTWQGGVAVPDLLGCPYDAQNSHYQQILLGGGWQTTPEYGMYFEPLQYPETWPTIWKNP